MIPGTEIPGWWIWLFWASPIKWAFEGLLINELAGATFTCTSSQFYPLASGGSPPASTFGGARISLRFFFKKISVLLFSEEFCESQNVAGRFHSSRILIGFLRER